LNLNPSLDDISRLLSDRHDNKVLRKIRNIIIDIRLHSNNFSPEKEKFNQSKDLRLQLNGIDIDVEESRESILAAIKLLEARLDLFRI
jgi:ribosome-associated translation inhibitor RaiA